MMNRNFIKKYVITIILWMSVQFVYGQAEVPALEEVIAVTARPSLDSITLRWAPMRFNVWRLGNENGYRIERYLIARNGKLLANPEKRIIHPSMKPLPENQWESLVRSGKYAAIAAQALFGDRFKIDLKNSDVFTIVNKVRENEQRFSFALFCADMSPEVARASGLMCSDRNVRAGEKYLYRIIVNAGDSLRGSVFISPEKRYELPKPKNLSGDFKDEMVHLKWDKNSNFHYTAYRVERAEDGINFKSISDSPLVTVSPTETADTRYHYAVDSLGSVSKIIYYRVKGLTPFGEESPPSNVISGKALPSVKEVPYISSVESPDNKSLHIRWDFSSDDNDAIRGFTLERASHPKGKFTSLKPQLLSPATRKYKDEIPQPVNYYRVIALGLHGARYPSPVFYGQLIDSIPPASPEGLQSIINEEGVIKVSWRSNEETDMYGYRVYKANYRSEELAQLTTSPIVRPFVIDTIDLNTLNGHAYYSVMAIDKNQNHSKLSEILEVVLPDKVHPQPPVLLPLKSDSRGVKLSWIQSPSEDVTAYAVYRKRFDESQWKRVAFMKHDFDTVYRYLDENIPPGEVHLYTLLAIDDAGLESDPADPVSARKIDNSLQPAVNWRSPILLREENQLTLRWKYDFDGIRFYRIYKASFKNPLVLYKIVPGNVREFKDTLIPTEDYTYRIMAVFKNEKESTLSEALFVDY